MNKETNKGSAEMYQQVFELFLLCQIFPSCSDGHCFYDCWAPEEPLERMESLLC